MVFLVLDTMDKTGHKRSFSPTEEAYYDAMEYTDGLLQRVIDIIDSRPNRENEEWMIAITTDHGGGNGKFDGSGSGHGDFNEYCRLIWLILAGDGLKKGIEIPPDCET